MSTAWIVFRKREIEQGLTPTISSAYDRRSALEWAGEEDTPDVITIPVEWHRKVYATTEDTAAKIAWCLVDNIGVSYFHANGYATFHGAAPSSAYSYRDQTRGGAWSPLSDPRRDPAVVLAKAYRVPVQMVAKLPPDPFMAAARKHLGLTVEA